MSYYDSDQPVAQPAFDDPTEALEVSAEDDNPEGDLGDGLGRARRRSQFETIDPALLRRGR